MRTFKAYTPDQIYLLPPNMADWLPEGHLAQFVSEVVDQLDLQTIFAAYENGDERGQPPYHPGMMLKLLMYGYCTGKPSSRKIEKATWIASLTLAMTRLEFVNKLLACPLRVL